MTLTALLSWIAEHGDTLGPVSTLLLLILGLSTALQREWLILGARYREKAGERKALARQVERLHGAMADTRVLLATATAGVAERDRQIADLRAALTACEGDRDWLQDRRDHGPAPRKVRPRRVRP